MNYPSSMGFKKSVLATCAVSALMVAGAAQAQTADAAAASVEEVVVTGSRIVRSGYSAPTPLAVLGVEAIQDRASSNVADVVNTMPVFSGSSTPSSTAGSVSAGTGGVNALNLRGLGVNRTLVLIDGQRSVGAFLSGAVDVNTIPQQLIERVEVVTGGASAVYGSDAVGGVVNFILNKNFTGFAGEVSGGMTSYKDDKTAQAQFTVGTPFASDRGHVTFSAAYVNKEGINYGDGGNRDWGAAGWSVMRNPTYTATNGQPQLLLRDRTSLADATRGGLIVSGPLKGTAFGQGGSVYQFNFGPLNDGRIMQGGDWADNDIRPEEGTSLSPSEDRVNFFGRVSYELTDHFNIFAQAAWAKSKTFNNSSPTYNFSNITNVRVDNPFLPESVRARAVAAGVTTFTMGSLNYDLPNIEAVNERDISRLVVGADGDFDLFGQNWKWDGYFQHGESVNLLNSAAQTISANYDRARDAVRNTAGQIVCRSTLTDPANGCLPYNLFGVGVNSSAVIEYVTETSFLEQTLKQDVWGASVTGEPFSLWAGPVSMALNFEHRKDTVAGFNDPLSRTRAYRAGNYQVSNGEISVTEAAAEAVIPLAKDMPFADTWDLQLAGRITDYSTSGRVETWKVGTTYSPHADIKFRAALSRDIRAPNLQELLQGPTGGSSGVFDPLTGLQFSPFGIAQGNPNLTPEIAKNLGFGVVVQPSFLPGFGASIDYWKIEVDDAIASLASQPTIDLCFRGGAGSEKYCAAITRNAQNAILSVVRTNYNQAFARTRGIDFEGSYRLPLSNFNADWGGTFTLRALATHYLEAYAESGLLNEVPTDVVGENADNGPPKWRYNATLSYDLDPLRLSLTGRGVSNGVYSNSWVVCSTGCPTSTVDHQTIDNNKISGAFYWDANASYKFTVGNERELEVFASVRNLLNKDPAVAAELSSGTAWYGRAGNAALYDVLGRVYRVGLRFRM